MLLMINWRFSNVSKLQNNHDVRNLVLLEILEYATTIRDRLALDDLDDMIKLYERNTGFQKLVDQVTLRRNGN